MTNSASWRPTVSLEIQKKRAMLYHQIREFMQERDILEVETPILSRFGNPDPYLENLKIESGTDQTHYLHTSPEYFMKRLLCMGSGSIYQMTHVFRDGETGRQHATEFRMLEWYHVDFDYYQLMDEVDELLSTIGLSKSSRITYRDAFQKAANIDPHTVELQKLHDIAALNGWETDTEDKHELLDYIFSTIVIKALETDKPLIIYDYPIWMAALSTIKQSEPLVSERFELFINGMEIANGFNELIDAAEQRTRFNQEIIERTERGQHIPPIDENFLETMEKGMPECAGIAVGLDRLLMVLTNTQDINDIQTFPLANN